MLREDLFDSCFQLWILPVCVELKIQIRKCSIDNVVCAKCLLFREEKAQKRRIRRLSLCEVVIRKWDAEFLHHPGQFFIAHAAHLTLS